MKKAIYSGSFDPIHSGHLDIIKKASKFFKTVYVIVTNNINKKHKEDILTRCNYVKEFLIGIKNIQVITNKSKLTAVLAKELNVQYLIRGIRSDDDIKYELELADGNKLLNQELETIFLTSDVENRKISSSILKEIEYYKNGGNS